MPTKEASIRRSSQNNLKYCIAYRPLVARGDNSKVKTQNSVEYAVLNADNDKKFA